MAPVIGTIRDQEYHIPGLANKRKCLPPAQLLRRPRPPKELPALITESEEDEDPEEQDTGYGSVIRLFQNTFELEALQNVLVDPILQDSGCSREPSLGSPPPPSESEQLQKARLANTQTSSATTKTRHRPLSINPSFLTKEDMKYVLDPLLREKTNLGTYVLGKSLAKPFKPRGPDPLPRRPPRRNLDLHLYYDVDDPRYYQPPAFTLEYFVYTLAEHANLSVPRVRKVVYSKHNVKKLTDLLAKEINPATQDKVHMLTVDTSQIPAKENRIPHRQLLYEMASLVKLHIKEITGSDMKSTIRPVSKFSTNLSEIHKNHSEIVLYEDNGDQRARTATKIIQQTEVPGVDAVLHSAHSRFFEGSGRSRSPFAVPEDESITPSELAILDTLMSGGTALSLKAHFIESLPDITPMTKTLVYLNLSFNNFRDFPLEVLELSNLEILKLRNNPIAEIPSDITKLSKLRILIASFCLISSLPLSLFQLPSLEDLGLNYNKLTFIPKDISQLQSLKVLDIEGNQIYALPASCLSLVNLNHVNLRNNFMHPLFWKDFTKNKPQKLLDLSCVQVYKSNLHKNLDLNLRKDLFTLFNRVEICDCCKGPMFGPGLKTICAVSRLFSIKIVPIFFRACTPECLAQFRELSSEKMRQLLYPS